MNRVNLELEFMSNGTIPPSHGEGCVYKLVDSKAKQFQIWECHKESDGQYDENGQGYLHNYEPYYVLGYFPSRENVTKLANDLEQEYEEFDYDEFLMNIASPTEVHSLPIFIEQASALLPFQDWWVEDGRVYARDEKSQIVRELVRIEVWNKGEFEFKFFTLIRSGDTHWNFAKLANVVYGQDSKMPLKVREEWNTILVRWSETLEVKVEDVYVHDIRRYEHGQ